MPHECRLTAASSKSFKRGYAGLYVTSTLLSIRALKARLRYTRKLARAPFPRLIETMHILFFTVIALFSLEKATTTGAQTCYFPNGAAADRDIPCRAPTSNQASACCAYSDICLDNSLCLAQSGIGIITRGSCTDQNWQSSACARYCQDGKFSTMCILAPFHIIHRLLGYDNLHQSS